MGLMDMFSGILKPKDLFKGEKRKCPNCKTQITLDMERCPKCGVRISSMFRKKCPKCKTLNDLDAAECTKCKYSYAAELERAKKTAYKCPICGYEADYYMMKCPACSTRFG